LCQGNKRWLQPFPKECCIFAALPPVKPYYFIHQYRSPVSIFAFYSRSLRQPEEFCTGRLESLTRPVRHLQPLRVAMAGILQSFMSGVANLLSAPPADVQVGEVGEDISLASSSISSSNTSETIPNLQVHREAANALANNRLANEVAILSNFNNPPSVSTQLEKFSPVIMRPNLPVRAQRTPSQSAAVDIPVMNLGLEFIRNGAASTSLLYGAQSASHGRTGNMSGMLSLRLPFSVHVGSTSAANHPGFFTVVTKRAQKAQMLRAQDAEAAAADVPRYNSMAPPLVLEDEQTAASPEDHANMATETSGPLPDGTEKQLSANVEAATPSIQTGGAVRIVKPTRAIFKDFSQAAANTEIVSATPAAAFEVPIMGNELPLIPQKLLQPNKPQAEKPIKIIDKAMTGSKSDIQAHQMTKNSSPPPAGILEKHAIKKVIPPNTALAKRSRAAFEAEGKSTGAPKASAKHPSSQAKQASDVSARRNIFEIQGTGKWIFGPKNAQKTPTNLSSEYTRMCSVLYWPTKPLPSTAGELQSIPTQFIDEAITFTMSVDEKHLSNYCLSNMDGPSFLFQTWEVKAMIAGLLCAAVPSESWEETLELYGITVVETAPGVTFSDSHMCMRRRTAIELLAALQHVNEFFAGNLFESCREIRRVAAAKALGYDVHWTFSGDWISEFSMEVLILEGSLIVEKLSDALPVRWKWIQDDGSQGKNQPIIGFYSTVGLCMRVFTNGSFLLPGQKQEKYGPACKAKTVRRSQPAGAASLLLLDNK
jgi:hypothetical protein